MSTFTVPTIFTAVDKFTAPMRKMTAATKQFTNKAAAGVDRLDRRLRKLTPSLSGVGKQMLAFAGTAALISGISGAVTIVKDFEQANANLAAKMGVNITQNKALTDDAIRLGSVTAKTASEVSELQFAYAGLGFTQEQILQATEATINGSVGMNASLAETAELAGAVVSTFDNFTTVNTPEILDKMTLATQKSALTFEKLSAGLPNVAGAANAAGVDFDTLLALMGKLSDAGIDASASGTALKNIFIKAAEKGSSYSEILEDIAGSQDQLTAAVDATGKIAAVSAAVLSQKLSETSKLTNILKNDFDGVAKAAADTSLDTFEGSLTLLGSAYEGLLLDINNSTGALGGFRTLIDFVTNNIKTIAIVIGVAAGAFLALKIGVLAAQGAMFAYNVVVGVSQVMSATQATSIGASNVAMKAQMIASYAVAAAQWVMAGGLGAAATATWVFTAALLANPITWIILAIVALIAALVALVVYFEDIVNWVKESDSMFAKFIRASLLPIILIFKAIGWAINVIIEAFTSLVNWVQTSDSAFAGFIRGTLSAVGSAFSLIGDAIMWVVDGLVWLWDAITEFTSEQMAPLFAIIDFFSGETQKQLGVDISETKNGVGGENGTDGTGAGAELLNPKAAQQEGLNSKIEEVKTNNLNININDPGGNADVENDAQPIGINVSSTVGG
jgi:hypothetical protein